MTLLKLVRLLRTHARNKARIGREAMRDRVLREIMVRDTLRELRRRG
mgnify:CR=1 FL=1